MKRAISFARCTRCFVFLVGLLALFAACLLLCLACATPFPIENLEEGMTMEAVRENFGEPKAEAADLWGDGKSCWTYWHEEQDWIATFLFPVSPLIIPATALLPGYTWDAWYFVRNSVFLDFEEEKLVRWEAIEPNMTFCSSDSGPAFPLTSDNAAHWMSSGIAGSYQSVPCPSRRDPPTCVPDYGPRIPGRGGIPKGPQWVFDPSTGHPEPDTSCEPERPTAEGRVEASDTRYVAKNYVSLWLDPTASSNEERISVNRGQPLKILGRRCGWCRVEDNVGTKGWVGCVFLESKPH